METQPNTSSALQLPGISTYSGDRDPGNSWEAWAGSFQIIQHETDLKKHRETFQSRGTARKHPQVPLPECRAKPWVRTFPSRCVQGNWSHLQAGIPRAAKPEAPRSTQGSARG